MRSVKGFSIFVAVLAFATAVFAANGVMKGDGSAASPFQIEDYEDLKAIGKGVYLYSSDYVLTKDIDASASKNEMCNEDGCNGFISLGKNKDAVDSIIFWGNIDGKNHTISNLTIWLPCENDVAFVSYLGGSITNLNFDHIHVTGRVTEANYVASVAAKLVGSIKNVHVTNGFVQGQNFVGGIVGHATNQYNKKAVFEDVSFQGDIKGSQRVGGIVGQLDMDLRSASVDAYIVALKKDAGGVVGYLTGGVFNSRSSGTIVPGYPEISDVGGIAGYSKGSVNACASSMNVTNYGYEFYDDIGGIVGDNEKGAVSYSYALGNVDGDKDVGGVVGSGGSVYASFAMGEVRGNTYVGGIAGSDAIILHSYAANLVRGKEKVGGLIGDSPDSILSSYWNTEISGLDTSAGGVGLTTAQMLKWESYAGWDTVGYEEQVIDGTDTCLYYEYVGACYVATGNFIKIWDIDEGKSFPYLNENPFSKKTLIPIAVPTALPKWQEQPKVAALVDVEGELVGKWTGFVDFSRTIDSVSKEVLRDTLYYGYRIGAVVGKDTVWGTSSYVAIPNKIEISTYAELQKIGNDPAYPLIANYELTADIDASSSKFKPIGDTVRGFYGNFDGKNHTIKNLEIDEPTRDFTGMFGYVESGVIQNLTLENAKVRGSWVVGALIGEARSAEIRHVVSLNGDVFGEHAVGGLIGSAISGSIEFVGTTGKIKGTDNVGGVVGDMDGYVTMTDVFSVNVIKGFEDVGGVIGYNYQYIFGEIEPYNHRIYSASMLKTPEYAAEGILGDGGSKMLDTNTCFFDSTVAGIGRKGKTTAEMLKQSTYKGYNFDSVWTIQEGVSYPYFKGMDPILPGTLVDDGTVNVLAGVGTEINPYKIYDYEDLKYIGKYEYGLDAYYKLMGNIDATRSFKENCNADSTLCKGFEPIGEFSGVFIGNNKIIAGLNINRPDEDSVGLFRALAEGAKVSGIVFDTTSYFGESYSLGYSHTKGVIRGKNYVGTLAGVDNGAEIERIYVKSGVHGMDYVGGIVGKKSFGSLSLSASRDTVSGKVYVGGLVGGMRSLRTPNTIKDCYSIATVLGEQNVGGLTGYSNTAWVENSFGAGNVVGTSDFGGIVGKDIKSTYTSVYYDSTLWFVTTTAAGELKTTDQMVKKETYKDWDFEKTWRIAADTTYPYFTWISTSYYISKTMDEKIRPNRNIDKSMMHMAGSGTEDAPFLIKTYGDLKSIGFGKYKMSAVYKLANDIDASASATEILDGNASKGFKPIGEIEYFGRLFGDYGMQDTEPFSGKFYGNGFSINNLTMYYSHHSDPLGFIDTLASSGLVENLTFKNYSFVGSSVAGVVGTNYGVIKNVNVEAAFDSTDGSVGFVNYNKGSVENCTIKAKVNGNMPFAGIAYANDGKIVNVKVDVSGSMGEFAGIALVNGGVIDKASVTAKVVSEYGTMAGIAGLNRKSGSISASSATVDMTSINGGSGYVNYYEALYQNVYIDFRGVGGLVGVDSGSVIGSTVSGVIDAPNSHNVGGLIGSAYGTDLKDLHASVDVSGANYVGGFAGISNVKISSSYATGNVKGKNMYDVGGFVGKVDSLGVIEKSFASGNVDGGAGFAGENYGLIKQSYSAGDVRGQGSFITNNQSKIEDCYSTGDVVVTENYYGFGFAGINGNNAEVRGYATGTAVKEGIRYCGGLPKYTKPSDEYYYLADNCSDSLIMGKGLSPMEMRLPNSFATFDFNTVWDIKEGVSYPMLRGMPNVPFVGAVELAYGVGNMQANTVRETLRNKAFVVDSSAKKVIKIDSASEALLDSLEKAGKAASGEFEIAYRVGMLFDGDTIWGSSAKAKLMLQGTTVVSADRMTERFNATLNGGHVALRFGLASAGVAKFSLLDMQGRVVRSLDLGLRTAGTHFETVDVQEIGRGRYIGVLQVNGKVKERTLLIKR